MRPPISPWTTLRRSLRFSATEMPSLLGRFELAPRASFRFKTQAHPGWDGTVNCRILEIEREKRISYTWVVGDMELDTVVSFTITPTPAGSHLSLVQSGFKPHQKQNFGGARYGWRMMGGRLIDLLTGLS